MPLPGPCDTGIVEQGLQDGQDFGELGDDDGLVGVALGLTDLDQVRSITQFYSVDFSNSRIGVKKCNCNKRTKVCVGRF